MAVRLPTVGEPVSEMVTRKPIFSAVNDVVVLPVSVMIPFVLVRPVSNPLITIPVGSASPGVSAIV